VRREASRPNWLRRLGPSAASSGPNSENARVLEAWKIRPVDGDTFWYGGERVRIRGYDAPERSESGGLEALQRLEWLLQEGQVVMVPQAVDVYGRTVADVYVDARNVAAVMAAEGYIKPK
jgi:micrococcal nuclease